ncbi:MAG: OmpA family protein [Bacteroidota bacterium]
MKTLYLPVFLLVGISFNLIAQEKINKEPISSTNTLPTTTSFTKTKSHNEIYADKYFFRYAFNDAIESYNDAKELTIEGQRNLAESYQKMGLYTESEAAYAKFINSAQVLPEDYFNFAMTLKSLGTYDQAMGWMDKFAFQKPNDLRAISYLAHKSEFSSMIEGNTKYKIEHLSINTNADDFGTCFYKDKIVFSSTQSTKKMFVRKYNWSGKPFWNIYVADIDGNQLKTAQIFDKKLNGKMHEGPASFSNDGNFMAFTRNYYDMKRKDNVVELQICFSNFKDGKWSKPESFKYNNKDYSVGQPCLTANGNTMYFTSDMPGGFGGSDLYKVAKSGDGEWGNPENLGSKINTECDEMFPFFEEKSNTLFFSSNGHFGLGGLDIFSFSMETPAIGGAKNLGSPFNTQFDDFAFIVNDQKNLGYFSSNRAGGSGGDDIYSFELSKVIETATPEIQFAVNAPKNVPSNIRVRETFPLRNYVFFNIGSTEIPNRYVMITKEQVANFKEDQLEVFVPKTLSGRPSRQMVAYYNVINILGDRMEKNPKSTIILVGSSEKGAQDGREMAMSVKKYLVDIFGIEASRITIEGRTKPKIPSEQPGGTLELNLLREGDRRVTIESTSPALLMEFQSGKNSTLKPVIINNVQTEPVNNYLEFQIMDGSKIFSSWTLEISDENGMIQSFGPYTQDKVTIPENTILGTRADGKYKAKMVGNLPNGKILTKDTTVSIIRWAPIREEEGMRFSIIYEFNNSKAINIYKKYLTEVVVPKIPINGTVIIHGYTDIIGDSTNNKKLSIARANDVKKIFENALSKSGRKDVKFEVIGYGEALNKVPFENKFPEERFYNRTVVIDIVPAIKK